MKSFLKRVRVCLTQEARKGTGTKPTGTITNGRLVKIGSGRRMIGQVQVTLMIASGIPMLEQVGIVRSRTMSVGIKNLEVELM